MKHLLNNMSKEEKDAIREQHTGGMRVVTENFHKLLGSKLGDVKPLTEQSGKNVLKAIDTGRPGPGAVAGKVAVASKVAGASATPATNKALVGQTVNLYKDVKNTILFKSNLRIKNLTMIDNLPALEFDGGGIMVTVSKFQLNCTTGGFTNTNQPYDTYYNTKLANELKTRFCTKSSGGTNVPKADFAANTSTSDSAIA